MRKAVRTSIRLLHSASALSLGLFLQLTVGACGGALPADDSSALRDGGADASEPVRAKGRREQCNGIDDDLDGRIDEGCPIRITRDPKDDAYPSLSGTRVAWTRDNADQTGVEIWVRDLPYGNERLIAKGYYPSLSGNRVAFLRDNQIIVYDLNTTQETVIDCPDARFVQAPRLDGDRVAWSQIQKGGEENYEVVVFDLKTRERFIVGSHDTIQEFPLLSGNTLVWNDDRFGHHTVGLYHLYDIFWADLGVSARPHPIAQVTHRSGDLVYDFVTALDQNRVALNESRGDLLDTRQKPRPCTPIIVDLQTGIRTAIAPETRECYGVLALSGNRAILEYDAYGVSDLYLVKLQTGERLQLTNYPRRSTRAKLDGNLLVWQDDRNDTWDLYMMDLTDIDSGDLHPEGVDL